VLKVIDKCVVCNKVIPEYYQGEVDCCSDYCLGIKKGKKQGAVEELERCLKELERLREYDKAWKSYFYDEAKREAPQVIFDLEKRLKELKEGCLKNEY
jgi:hypothetical protein